VEGAGREGVPGVRRWGWCKEVAAEGEGGGGMVGRKGRGRGGEKVREEGVRERDGMQYGVG